MIALLLFACTADDPQTEDSVVKDTGTVDETLPPLPPAYSEGTCPDFSGDEVTFQSSGEDREFLVLWPDEPVGAPLWFNWHWLGGSASESIRLQDLSEIADLGYIVVVPEARAAEDYEWAFYKGADDTLDLTFFDDVLGCMIEQYDIDRKRVYTTGMSAGGLWSTNLAMNRSEYLAAAAPLSGGTEPFQAYDVPTRDIPMMLTWGGPDDLFGGISFEDATFSLQASLEADGHFVLMCEHPYGHVLPPVGLEHVVEFFAAHEYGDALPWQDELPSDLWSGCSLEL
ncbi:MAG: putative esterase [Cognaticolwellia sp.]|jgi:predicted esterase